MISTRAYWSPHPEHPKAYGEGGAPGSLGAAEGKAAFDAVLNTRLDLGQPGTDGWTGGEVSPYGPELGVEYPHADLDVLLPAMKAYTGAWRAAGPEIRALVCLEILSRISGRTHELAHAVMHTSGQAFMMAFQAGGPHAQDRGLEAVAYAYREQVRTPDTADWSKPQGKRDPLKLHKSFITSGRGIALLIGCNTFPTWNGYPGLFASSPPATRCWSSRTRAPCFHWPSRCPWPVRCWARRASTRIWSRWPPSGPARASPRPSRSAPRSGSSTTPAPPPSATGWRRTPARPRSTRRRPHVNTIVVDSTDDYRGMLANLAFSLSLYSGQMCTTPQNLLIPRDGIATDDGAKSYDDVVADIAAAVTGLLGDDARAAALLGALVNPDVKARVEAAGELGEVALDSRTVANPEFPDAVVRTPVVVKLDGTKTDDGAAYLSECFGPVSFAVAVESTTAALDLLRRTIRDKGAMTVGAYTTSPEVERAIEDVCLDESAQLSLNLTGGVYVNQTAAFSDFHGSGGNPAANAALCDGAFVANRFRVVEVRRQA